MEEPPLMLEIRGGRNEDMVGNHWLARPELPTRPYSGNLSSPGRWLDLTFDSEGTPRGYFALLRS